MRRRMMYNLYMGKMNNLKRTMWEIWKDECIPSRKWMIKTPIGNLRFKTKKLAGIAHVLYEKDRARG